MTFEEFLLLPEVKTAASWRDKNYIEIQWSQGGVSGGSCWDTGDGDPHHRFSGEAEPEFEDLDKLLEALCPNISFLQYKNLCREVIETDEKRQNDYYGNYTDYAIKRVELRNLYRCLSEREII